jgi:hypothetical protein
MGWRVTGSSETLGTDDRGIAVPGVDVRYQLDSGLTGTVFIPRSMIQNTDYVKNKIASDAAGLDAIKGLAG